MFTYDHWFTFAARVIRLRSREELRTHAVGGSGLDLDADSALLTSLNSISVRRRTGAEIPIRWPPISQSKVRKDKDVQEIICFTPIAMILVIYYRFGVSHGCHSNKLFLLLGS